jgi:putative membrane protein
MSRTLLLSCAVFSALTLAACHKSGSNADQDLANPADSAPVNTVQDVAAGPVGLASAATIGATTEGFVPAAAMADMYEIEAGKIAVQRGKSADVKKFGQMMIDHHTKLSNDFKAALKAANIAEPPATLDDRRQGLLNNLRAAGDTDFDAAYLHQQAAAHLEALTLHKTYASRGDNATLKAAAEKAQPIVQSHIDELRRIGGDAVKDLLPGDNNSNTAPAQ